MCGFFFFSSRRRHTRCSRDWSSDVCSSDLLEPVGAELQLEMIARHTLVGEAQVVVGVRSEEEGAVVDLGAGAGVRSEEHTSELQSRLHLVCRLLLEKKKKAMKTARRTTIHN